MSVGIDIQSVGEVEASLANFGRRYVERVFSRDEADFAFAHPHTAAQLLAGRFAAREAVLKLLKLDDAMKHWNDITVTSLHHSQVKAVLTGESRRRAERLGLSSILISLSSAGDVAIAVAIAESNLEDIE